MRGVEYTYDWYRDFLHALDSRGWRFRSYDDELADGDVLLRHDVDLSPARAVEMAQLEADVGVQSTYFFLCSTPMYNLLTGSLRDVVSRIEALGHDVGLHFSTHQYWDGDTVPSDADIARRVDAERDALAAVADDPIETVSFHAPPEWVLERVIDGVPSTYEPRFFSDIGYSADSSGRWRTEPPRIETFKPRMQVLTHPGLWGWDDQSFAERVRSAGDDSATRARAYATRRYLDEDPAEDPTERLP